MRKLNRLRFLVLAAGVLASAAFYVCETGFSKDTREVVFFGEEPGSDGSFEGVGSLVDPYTALGSEQAPTAETLPDALLSAIDEIVRDAVADMAAEELRAALREEILLCGEEGYLADALSEAYMIAESEAEARKDMVDLNTATAEELCELPGIGASRAEDIIAYRESIGGFSDITEIMNVSGIKEKTFENIREHIYV